MPRVVKSREEFEGEIFESLVLVEGTDLPLPAAGTEFTEIAKSRRRDLAISVNSFPAA